MGEINYDKLRKSLDNLRKQYEYCKEVRSDSEAREVVLQAASNSVILCWAICFEMLWKHMQKYLEQDLAEVPPTPKGVFRSAHESGMIEQPMLAQLFNYADIRSKVSRDGSQESVSMAIDSAGDFIEDAEELCREMAEAQ